MDNITHQILAFLTDIGLAYRLEPIVDEAFLPGLDIQDGELVIDLDALMYPGDILHEAGHIAVADPARREIYNHNLLGVEGVDSQLDGEELAAMAWSVAASRAIGLSLSVVFHENGYNGGSQSLIDAYEGGAVLGQPLLHAWDMCGADGAADGFPIMKNWFRQVSWHEPALA